jgi:imidazolonepropionase-like amidohydrolase
MVSLLLAFLLLSIGAPATREARASETATAFVGAKLFPSPAEAPIEDGVIVIENGKITTVGTRRRTRIPEGSRVVEVAGCSILSGFWNSHVHFIEAKWAKADSLDGADLEAQLQEMLTRYGFTHVVDTGSPVGNTLAIRRRIESGELRGPAILTTGTPLFPRGGSPPGPILEALGFLHLEGREIARADQAADRVAAAIEEGSDAIKVYAAVWTTTAVAMPLEVLSAITRETHARGRLVFAHPADGIGFERSVRSGVDVIVHTAPTMGRSPPDLIDTMRAKRIALIPTLQLWEYETRHHRRSAARAFITEGVEQLRAFAAADGIVLFGTDVGYSDRYDPTREYELLAEAGLRFEQILAAVTTAPAERFGAWGRTGRLASGMDADLVVLEADPSREAGAFARVRITLRRGITLYEAP